MAKKKSDAGNGKRKRKPEGSDKAVPKTVQAERCRCIMCLSPGEMLALGYTLAA